VGSKCSNESICIKSYINICIYPLTCILHSLQLEPNPPGAAHQGGAVVLFSISMFLLHSLQFARAGAASKMIKQAANAAKSTPRPAPVMAASRRTE
jgi:hypothetical protein